VRLNFARAPKAEWEMAKGAQVKQGPKSRIFALVAVLAMVSATRGTTQEKRAAQDDADGLASIQGKNLSERINADGSYAVLRPGVPEPVVTSGIEADVDGHVLLSSAYPRHKTAQAEFRDEFGAGTRLTVTHTGLAGAPDLILIVKLYRDLPWGEMSPRD
jgi:hypothetical protein